MKIALTAILATILTGCGYEYVTIPENIFSEINEKSSQVCEYSGSTSFISVDRIGGSIMVQYRCKTGDIVTSRYDIK